MQAGQAAGHMLSFRLALTNNGNVSIRLNRITVVAQFAPGAPGVPPALVFQFDRDVTIAAGAGSGHLYLDPDETIGLPAILPAVVRIQLAFDNFTDPVVVQGPVVVHRSPTPQGSYSFFAIAEDMRPDEYFTPKTRHSGGSQLFGYDFGVAGPKASSTEFSNTLPDTDGSRNEHNRAYGKRIHALADGIVVSFSNDVEENPVPGRRALIRYAEAEAGAISALSLVTLSSQRVVTAVRTAAGTLKLIAWAVSEDGKNITRLGDNEGAPITAVDAIPLSSTRLATAVRTASGNLRMNLWSLSSDGKTITETAADEAGPTDLFGIAKLSGERRFVCAVRTAAGTLKLIAWEYPSDGNTLTRRGSAEAGNVKRISIAGVSATRVCTAVRTEQDTLKLISWDVDSSGNIARRGDLEAGTISDVAVALVSLKTERVVTSVRLLGSGNHKMIAWNIDTDGKFERRGEETTGPVQAVAVARVTDDDNDFSTSVITGDDRLEVSTWKYDDDKQDMTLYSQSLAGPTSMMDLARVRSDGPHFQITAVKTENGSLKLINWFLVSGGGNCFRLLHGNEMVLYAHMQRGSLNPALCKVGAIVNVGDFLGKLGNSGSSSGPHLHIHASRVPDGLTPAQVIAAHQNDTLGETPFRPLPFHNAQAMRLSDPDNSDKWTNVQLVSAPGDNPFTMLNGQALYWERMAVWPGLGKPGVAVAKQGAGVAAVN